MRAATRAPALSGGRCLSLRGRSIQRQLSRGRAALEHNRLVAESGEGELAEVRETDLSVKAAKNRYSLFVEGTMAANEALKRTFPYNLINASGSVDEVKAIVMSELAYQSSLELAEDTYNAIKHIPTVSARPRRGRSGCSEAAAAAAAAAPASPC